MPIPMIMKDPSPEDTIKAVINTLNQVNVNGKQNLDRLLGSIVALEKVLGELTRKEEEKCE